MRSSLGFGFGPSALLLTSLLFGSVAAASAQETSAPAATGGPLAALLAKPASAATVASLLPFAADPAAQARLTDAFTDARASVRAVAARVAYVSGSRPLLPAMRTALAREQDPDAANELLRAVVAFGDAGALADAWTAVDRLKPHQLTGLAEGLARSGRPELLEALPRLVSHGLPVDSLLPAVLDQTAADPARRAGSIASLLEKGASHATLLAELRSRKEAPPADLLAGWLRSDDRRTRSAALWHVVIQQEPGAAAEPLKPLGIDLEQWRAEVDQTITWETLGVELIARGAGLARRSYDWLKLADAKGP